MFKLGVVVQAFKSGRVWRWVGVGWSFFFCGGGGGGGGGGGSIWETEADLRVQGQSGLQS